MRATDDEAGNLLDLEPSGSHGAKDYVDFARIRSIRAVSMWSADDEVTLAITVDVADCEACSEAVSIRITHDREVSFFDGEIDHASPRRTTKKDIDAPVVGAELGRTARSSPDTAMRLH